MTWLFLICGSVLVLIGLLDVFFAVLNYDGFSFLSSRFYRVIWSLIRTTTRPLPKRLRHFSLSIGAPLMIPATLLLWMVIEILGFGLIYYSQTDYFSFTSGAKPTFPHMIYLSGVTIGTLGYGDITPKNPLLGIVTFTQALVGFSIITLFITYILNIYQVLQQWNTLASGLYHQAGGDADPVSLLRPHFPKGEPQGLDATIGGLHQNLTSYYEGVRRYPLVYYFHSRQARRSVPYVFRIASETTAALRWGLPGDHPATEEPGLPTLLTGVEEIMGGMRERFVPHYSEEEKPDFVSYETFSGAMKKGRDENTWLSRFIEMERDMRGVAHLESANLNTEESYERYREWLPFALRTDTFIRDAAIDLGYDPDRLSWNSKRKERA
ncbi:MAG: potassium channel family protein [Rubrobacteraceae bacterium]